LVDTGEYNDGDRRMWIVKRVARELPPDRAMPLRLKGEIGEETAEQLLPEPNLSASESVADDAVEPDEGQDLDGIAPSLPGPLVAAASFVPTFLAVYFGLSYLLGGGSGATSPASTPKPAVSEPAGRSSPVPPRLTREGFSSPAPAPRPDSDRGATGSAPPAGARLPEAKSPEATKPPVVPAPGSNEPSPPVSSASEPKAAERAAPPQVAHVPEPKAPELSLPPRQPPARAPQAPVVSRPAPEPPSSPGGQSTAALKNQGWIPAAAFADRAAATRLASSIQQQDYPVEIREDRSSARPWVVWIGPEPRGSRRRR
jgi:hypothetical protein